MLIFDSQL
jgi:large subunit ribosomal protein L15